MSGHQEDKLDWRVETMRVTAFPMDYVKMQNGWWDKLIAEPPEDRISRPKEGLTSERGPFENGKLILNTQPSRIDLIYTVDAEQAEGPPNLGSFQSGDFVFYTIVKKWLGIFYDIKRLAFGTILFYPVANKKKGYELISKYLHSVTIDPDNSSDFFYQINRPRNSEVVPLSINRLSKWSISTVQQVRVELTTKDKLPETLESWNACRLELDINTSQENRNNLPTDKLISIFEELISLGKEISYNGDII